MGTGAAQWRLSREYRAWRAIVVRRDGRCLGCHSIKGREAHHVKHATYWPELRFDPANGACLCRACHTNFHTNHRRSFREKCDEVVLENFFTLVVYYRGLPPATTEDIFAMSRMKSSPGGET